MKKRQTRDRRQAIRETPKNIVYFWALFFLFIFAPSGCEQSTQPEKPITKQSFQAPSEPEPEPVAIEEVEEDPAPREVITDEELASLAGVWTEPTASTLYRELVRIRDEDGLQELARQLKELRPDYVVPPDSPPIFENEALEREYREDRAEFVSKLDGVVSQIETVDP